EQGGREQAPTLERGRLLGAPGLKEFEKLLAGRILVPAAVALEDGDKGLCGLKALAFGIEHHGKIKARLEIIGVGSNGSFERGRFGQARSFFLEADGIGDRLIGVARAL